MTTDCTMISTTSGHRLTHSLLREVVELKRPEGERYAHSMDAAAKVIGERGFARIVGEVAISAAREQADHG
jgi:hypothetical protein